MAGGGRTITDVYRIKLEGESALERLYGRLTFFSKALKRGDRVHAEVHQLLTEIAQQAKTVDDATHAVQSFGKVVTTTFHQAAGATQQLPANIVAAHHTITKATAELRKMDDILLSLSKDVEAGNLSVANYDRDVQTLLPHMMEWRKEMTLAKREIQAFQKEATKPPPTPTQYSQTMLQAVTKTKDLLASMPEKITTAYEVKVHGEREIRRLKDELQQMEIAEQEGKISTDQLRASFAATYPVITRLQHEVDKAKDVVTNFGREYGMTGKELRKQNIIYFQGAQMVQDAMYGISNAVNNLSYMLQISRAPAYWQAIVTAIGVATLVARDKIDEAFRSIGDIILGKSTLIKTELDVTSRHLTVVSDRLEELRNARSVSRAEQAEYNRLLQQEQAIRLKNKEIEEGRSLWQSLMERKPGDEERAKAFQELFLGGEGVQAGQTVANALKAQLPQTTLLAEKTKKLEELDAELRKLDNVISDPDAFLLPDFRNAFNRAQVSKAAKISRDDVLQQREAMESQINNTLILQQNHFKEKLRQLSIGNEAAIREAMMLPGVDKQRLQEVLAAPGKEDEEAEAKRIEEIRKQERAAAKAAEDKARKAAQEVARQAQRDIKEQEKAKQDAAREAEEKAAERKRQATDLAGPIQDRIGQDVEDFLRKDGPNGLDQAAGRVTPQIADRIRGAVGDMADDVAKIIVDKIATELRGAFAGDEAAKGMPGQVAALIRELVAKNQQAWMEMQQALQMGNANMARSLNREIQNNTVRIRTLQNPMMRRVMN